MNISVPSSARRLALCTGAVVAVAAPMAASAAEPPLVADLRVETGSRALVAGSSFQTGTTSIATDRSQPACGGTGAKKRVPGPTALGTLIDAAGVTSALQPLRISDKFSFGLLVCGIGRAVADDDSFWLFKVNHVSPEVGADQFKVKPNDQVLWYFSDTPSGRNTGDELGLSAPVRARTGAGVKVRVFSYDFKGVRKPAPGAKVIFGAGKTAIADAGGVATVRRNSPGELKVRAVRGKDVPSPVVRVCVARELRECSPVRGKRIFGTLSPDSLRGTRGPDVLRASRGNDVIDVRGGGADLVRCGPGRDRVRATGVDRVSRDCEVLNGKARATR